MRFRKDSDEEVCGEVVPGSDRGPAEYGGLACLRTRGHAGECVSMMRDAARADQRCVHCRAPLAEPHRRECRTRREQDFERYLGAIHPRCRALWNENEERMRSAPGSRHNHQAWYGGYFDHVVECMDLAAIFYAALARTGRPLPFTEADALVVLFLHDVEKPWRLVERSRPTEDGRGAEFYYDESFPKAESDRFREDLAARYGIELTSMQRSALQFVEGEKGAYSQGKRSMNELAAFCHLCDVTSARIFFNYPR